MIKQFNDVPVRSSGVIYDSCLEQIKEAYAEDPVFAGEMAISICEMILTGQVSSDDRWIKISLANLKSVASKAAERYDKKVDAKKQAGIEKYKLDEIAEMLQAGVKQAEIARRLGISTSTVSDRVRKIRTEYPELIKMPNEKCPENLSGSGKSGNEKTGFPEYPGFSDKMPNSRTKKCPENPENPVYDNDNDNDNDNVKFSFLSREEFAKQF